MRNFSAEAVEDVMVMRHPRAVTERLTEENPAVARLLHGVTLKSLAAAQGRLMISDQQAGAAAAVADRHPC